MSINGMSREFSLSKIKSMDTRLEDFPGLSNNNSRLAHMSTEWGQYLPAL